MHLQAEMLCHSMIESWKHTPPSFSFCAMMEFSNYFSPKARSSICCIVNDLHCISLHFYLQLNVFASPDIFYEISYTLCKYESPLSLSCASLERRHRLWLARSRLLAASYPVPQATLCRQTQSRGMCELVWIHFWVLFLPFNTILLVLS